MALSRSSRPFRLMAILCIALVALFAGMSLSRTIDRIQHSPGTTHQGGHMLFSAMTAVEAHDADHHASRAGQEKGQDRLPDGHHHHSDSGAGVILATQAVVTALPFGDRLVERLDDPAAAGSTGDGQDRPPRRVIVRA